MKYHLIVSFEAKMRISQIADYVFMNWGMSVYQNWLNDIRQCVVISLNKIFYSIEGNDIIILSVEDVRMDPRKMMF